MIVLEGRGLHTGAPCRLALARSTGPACIEGEGGDVPLDRLPVVGTQRATTVAVGRRTVGTIEHLLAAFGGLQVRSGVRVSVCGPEIPVLDGGAAAHCEALAAVGATACPPRLRVVRAGETRSSDGRSVYTWEPADGVSVRVRLEYDDPRLALDAAWDGDAEDFRARIAPARTFALAEEVLPLVERGLASHVPAESVVVLAPDRVVCAGRAFAADEPARHKLLDLVGDLFLHGGPPRGRVTARRPGHTATHEATRLALASGLLAREA